MRLDEHEDFATFLTAAAAESALPEAFVEKDYWITEILRVIARTLPDRAIFKGGTSLSKGWGLLDRFSEDIDLFVDPSIEPALRGRAIDRALKHLKRNVEEIGGLEFVQTESRTIGGRGRIDTFRYRSRYPAIQGFPPTVRLEPGVQSGRQPTETVQISSIVSDMLTARGVMNQLGVTGHEPFSMTLLHYRRTFVEKLFAIHGKILRFTQEGEPLGRDARHYADLYVLAGRTEVLDMLSSPEYESIRLDYNEKSRTYFPNSHRPPRLRQKDRGRQERVF
jgi:Nucleotidyl transferase AbiEii toxin, Type IV TA system